MALIEGCRHALEISIPVQEVETETSNVSADVQKRAKLPGFRPGKVPASLVRKQFAAEIRRKVMESLIPKYLQKQFEADNLNVVGTPDISDVHFHEGEPLRFKAEFEVIPTIELGEYQGVEIPYHDPQVTDEDIAKRMEELRGQKADFVNLDPRPIENGDFAAPAGALFHGDVHRAGEAAALAALHPQLGYDRLFSASAQALQDLAQNPNAWEPASRGCSASSVPGAAVWNTIRISITWCRAGA